MPLSSKRAGEASSEDAPERKRRHAPSTADETVAPHTPDLVRRASTTILSSIGASRNKPLASLSGAEEKDLRTFYLHLMEKREREGWRAVEGVLMQVAEELRSANRLNGEGSSSGAAQPTTALSYVISQSGPCEGIRQTLEPAVVLCGRLGDCNCIVGHETLEGKLVENLLVSRVQFIMMRLGDELVVLDCWSVCGTRTVRRAAGKVLQSSKPGARATLLFGASETFTLEVAKEAKITFNPTDADVRAAAERASGHHGARQGSVTAQATVHESGSGSTIASAEGSTRGSTLTIDTTLT